MHGKDWQEGPLRVPNTVTYHLQRYGPVILKSQISHLEAVSVIDGHHPRRVLDELDVEDGTEAKRGRLGLQNGVLVTQALQRPCAR